MKKYYILYLLAISLLNSCGTKGQLYIPEEKYPQAGIKENIFPAQGSEVS
jgi:predicted small lipoprotein YifL